MSDPTTTTIPKSLLGATNSPTSAEPTYTPFSEWSADKADQDPIQLRMGYADYMRQTRLDANAPITVEVENNIQQGLYGSLVSANLLEEGDVEKFNYLVSQQNVEPEFDDKLKFTIANLGYDDADRDALVEFNSIDKVVKQGSPYGITEETMAKHAELKEVANNVILNRFNDAKIQAINNNKIPFAVFEDDNGERMIKTSDLASSMSLNEALKASRVAGASLADAYVAQDELSIPEGSTMPRYKIKRVAEMAEVLSELSKKDKSIQSTVEALGSRAALQEYDMWDELSYRGDEFSKDIGMVAAKTIGLFSESAAKKADEDYNARKELNSLTRENLEFFRGSITKSLEDSGVFDKGSIQPDDVDMLIKEIAIDNAARKGKFILHDEEGEYGKNIRKTALGTTIMQPAALMNENLFNKTIEARPDLSATDRKKLQADRLTTLTDNFTVADKIFRRTGSEDKWNLAVIEGRQQGKANHEILGDFLKDDDNYSNFVERSKGIGMSFVSGVALPVLGVLTAMGNDWSADTLTQLAQDNADRREVAEMFGQKMGFGQDMAEALVPMVVDIGATALLATVTAPAAGIGGAAYAAAKQGSRLTMKGMVQGIAKGAFRVAAGETAEAASKRIIAAGLIRESAKTVTGEGALAAIKAFNSLTAQRIGTSAASFIPAATRSGAGTYGSVSLALKKKQQELKLTDEEIHDRALGAALTSGMVTGIITSAFGAFGKAGVEDAMLRGLTFQDAKALLESLANVKNLSDAKFKEAVTKQLSASIKKLEKSSKTGFVKDAVDEAQEEGLDQLLNSFVEDAATDENTPFLERLKQTMYAAAMGATLGGGITLTRTAWNKVNPFKNEATIEQEGIKLERQFFIDITKRLNDSGSPITAQAVGRILTQQARSRPAPARKAPAATTPAATTPAATTPAATTPAATTPAATTPAATTPAATTPAATTPAPVTPVVLSTEAEEAVAKRESQIASLLVPLVGRKSVGKKAQRKITKLKQEIDFIRQTGNTKVPRTLPKPVAPAPTVETPEAQTPEATTLEQPSDITDINELFVRIAETPQEEADQLINNAIAQLEGNQDEPTIATIGADTISLTFSQEPVTIIPQVSEAAKRAAAVAGINTDEAAADTAKHVASFDPDADTDEASTKQKRRKKKAKGQRKSKPTVVPEPTVQLDAPLASFDTAPFGKGEQLSAEEEAEANAVTNLARKGFPVRFGKALRYGAVTTKNLKAKSEYLAKAVYAFFPPFQIGEGKFAYIKMSSRKTTYFDVATNQTDEGEIAMPIDKQDRGIFNNDPVVVAEMLAHRIPVFIPPSIDRASINPAFVVKGNFVVDVRKPSKDGKLMESAVTLIDETTTIAADNSLFYSYSNIPFYPDGVEGKPMPSGTASLDPLTGSRRGIADTMGELMSNVGLLIKNDGAINRILKSFKKEDLDEDFRDNAVQAAATEFLLLAHLHELRTDILASGKLTSTSEGSNNVSILPKKKNGAIKALQSRLKGDLDLARMAKVLEPLLSKKRKSSATHTDIVIQFIEDIVLNNKDLTGGFMPEFTTVLRRTSDRYLQQQIARKVSERNRSMVSLNEEYSTGAIQDPNEAFDDQTGGIIDNIDTEQLKNSSVSLGGSDPNSPLSERGFHSVVKDTITQATDAIDNDPVLRDTLNELAFNSVFPNADANVAAHVKGMSSRDLMARIGIWMTLGNHANRPDILEFVQELEQGGSAAGMTLKNALKLSAIAGRFEGNPLDNPAYVAEVQRMLSMTLGKEATLGRARNFIKEMDTAVRRRLSRAVVDITNKGFFRQRNAADISRLGLVSGDPESVIKALMAIAKSDSNPSHKLVAELLLEDQAFIRRVKFAFGSSQAPIAGEYVRHADGNHSVFLNTERGNGLGLENVLLEEYVHAFLSDTLTQPLELLSDKQRAARLRLEGLYELTKQAYEQQKKEQGESGYNASLESGLENMDEFVANFLLDPEFQHFIKILPTKQGQRGFFQRIVEAMVSMFRKVSAKEGTAYSQALKDIVDLSKTTIRSTAVPFNMQVATNVTRASNTLAETTNTPRLFTSVGQTTTTPEVATPEGVATEVEVDAEEQARTETDASVDTATVEGSKRLPTEKQKAQYTQLIQWLKSRIPAGTKVVSDDTIDGAAEAEGDVIRINHKVLMAELYNLDPLAQRGILDSILNEELGHHASFGSLTQSEIDAIVDSLSDAAFEEIANQYHVNNPQKIAGVLANLASSDPEAVRQQKRVLVEEKLRMRLQQVTRGYTTEDDVAFWLSKPSLLRVLKRYIGGVLNSYLNRKKLGMGSGIMDAAIFSMMQEMRAINMGFAKTNAYRALDTDSPAEAIAEYQRILNVNILDETDELYEAQDGLISLATSGLPLTTFTSLMQQAGLRVINGNEIVNDDTVLPPASPIRTTQPVITQGELDFNGNQSVDIGTQWLVDTTRANMGSVSYKISLGELESTLGLQQGPIEALENLFVGADITEYENDLIDALDAFDTNMGASMDPRIRSANVVELLSTYDPDSTNFDIAPFGDDGEIDEVKARLLIDAITLVEKMKLLNLDSSTPIPLTIRYEYDSSTRGTVVNQDNANRAAGVMTEPMAFLGGGTDLETPPELALDGMPLLFNPDMESVTLNIQDVITGLVPREQPQGIMPLDIGAVKETIDGLSIDYADKVFKMKLDPDPKKIDGYLVNVYRAGVLDANGVEVKPSVVSIELDIKDQNIIHVGWLGRTGGTTEEAAKIPFASALMDALVTNNGIIKATSIVTTGGGAGLTTLKRKYGVAYLDKLQLTLADLLGEDVIPQTFPATKDSARYGLYFSSSEMNGYYSWPAMGFKMRDDSELAGFTKGSKLEQKTEEFQEDITDYILNLNQKILDSNDLTPTTEQRLMEYTQDFIEKAKKEIADELNEFVGYATRPDGKPDIFQALHVSGGKRAAALWRLYGAWIECKFDLALGSDSLKSYVSRIFTPLVKAKTVRIEEVDEIIKSYREATSAKDISPEELQDIKDEHNEKAFDAGVPFKLFASFGQRSSAASSNLSNVDFSDVVELLEMPMFEYGAYKAQKGWLNIFRGDMSPPIKRLFEQREEFKRAASQLVISYKEKMDKLVIVTYGDKASADWALIAKAQGYVDGNLVSDATYDAIEKAYNNELDRIANDPALTPADKKIQRAAARQTRDQSIDAEETNAIAQVTIERDNALNQIQALNSDLAAHIVSMRTQLIQPVQQKLIAAGLDPNIGLKIDKTGGIYITRAYAMFNDPTYAERVRTDPQYQAVRDAAMQFFTKQLFDMSFSEAKSQGFNNADATRMANQAVQDANRKAPAGSSYGSQAMEAFLASYDQKMSPTPQTTKGLKEIKKNLKRRKDLPKELRDLLGEYGSENGTDLIVRTFSTVAMVAAQQTFLNNLAKTGTRQGFMVDAVTYAADPSKYPDYVPIRSGGSTKNDPLAHMYAPKDVVESLGAALETRVTQQTTTAQEAVNTVALVARHLTGKAMVAKTLGSVGFYLRNVVGNMVFFGPSQGFVRSDKIAMRTVAFSYQQLKDPNRINAALAELIGLGIVGDEIQPAVLKALLSGAADKDSMLASLDKFTSELPVVGATRKALAYIEQKATTLSGAIDAAYKIEYFQHELDTLLEARANDPSGKLAGMSDYDLKRMAAVKVKMTAQSASQAPAFVQALNDSTFGLMFAPFIRFKAEVPRIVWNTYKLGFEEINSGNPVLKARGLKRMTGMTTVIGALSMALPALISSFFGEVGDEEDEALRKSMPEYLRSHSFIIFRDSDNQLRSLDLTYVNPFSLLADPIMRALPHIKDGEVGSAAMEIVKGLFFNTYLDDQILAGNLADIAENKDSTTNQSIYINGVDEPSEIITKMASYVFSKTYTPRIVQDVMDSVNAMDGNYVGERNSPLAQLFDGMKPVKIHDIDLEAQHRRFLYDHAERFSQLKREKYALLRKQAISPDEIDEIYDREFTGRRSLNQELLSVVRGFERLGLNPQYQYNTMKSAGIGKDKARLLFQGIMDRPDIEKDFAEKLIQNQQQDRLDTLIQVRNRYNRYVFIEDPKTK
jgi:hypothetical protein